MPASSSPLGTALRWLGGPIVWAAYFLLVYASESLVCSRSQREIHLLLVIAASAVAVATLLAMIVRGSSFARTAAAPRSAGGAFMDEVAVGLNVIALLAVFWVLLPAIWIPACAAPS